MSQYRFCVTASGKADGEAAQLKKQLAEIEAKNRQELQAKDNEIRCLQEQFSRDIESTNNLLVNLEEEKSSMNLAMENQTAAFQQSTVSLHQDLLGLQAVTSTQSQDLDRKLQDLQQQCDGMLNLVIWSNQS